MTAVACDHLHERHPGAARGPSQRAGQGRDPWHLAKRAHHPDPRSRYSVCWVPAFRRHDASPTRRRSRRAEL